MDITIIGVVPPCPRCARMHELAHDVVRELGIKAEIRKIAYDAEEAQKLGKVGTAHHIAEWANMEMDWGKIRDLVSEGWSKELDDFLMPCKEKAEEKGWLMTPVLVIDGSVSFMGYVPEKEDIKMAIKKHQK